MDAAEEPDLNGKQTEEGVGRELGHSSCHCFVFKCQLQDSQGLNLF